MKKTILMLIIFFLIISIHITTYAEVEFSGEGLSLYDFRVSGGGGIDTIADTDEYYNEAIPLLKSTFGLEGDVIKEGTDTMKFNTQISVEQINGPLNKYRVTIGVGENAIKHKVKNEEELAKYGYDGTNTQWNVVLLGGAKSKEHGGNNTWYTYTVYAKKLYSQSEAEEKGIQASGGNEIDNQDVRTAEDIIEAGEEIIDFLGDFKKNPMGTIFTLVLDGAIGKIDVIQNLANEFQTIVLKTSRDKKVAYKYEELAADAGAEPSDSDPGAGNRDKYTKVSRGNVNKGDESWQKIESVDINNTDYKTYGSYKFSKNTKIPVIVVDPYTIATSRISVFDINFFVINEELHEPNSIWIKIRKILTAIIRITLYITSAILIISLIINGIILVTNTVMPPAKRRKHLEGLVKFAKSCALMVGTILIMAVSVYANEMFVPQFMEGNNTELPIRVNVAETGYSFSTTDTGYARFMAQIKNVDLSGVKFTYVFAYFFLALRNLLIAILMFIRTVLIFGLAVIGPIIVLFYSFDRSDMLPIDYEGWIRWYLRLASFHVILAFIFQFTQVIN